MVAHYNSERGTFFYLFNQFLKQDISRDFIDKSI